jgi:hypothetical protein
MKNIKDIVIGIFAVIGFTTIITGFTNEAVQETTHVTSESHVWEFSDGMPVSGRPKIYKLNKVTGEVVLLEGDKATKIQ